MNSDLDSIIGLIRVATRIGIRAGTLWHHAIEAANRRIDRWLWDEDWAWANNRRYLRGPRCH